MRSNIAEDRELPIEPQRHPACSKGADAGEGELREQVEAPLREVDGSMDLLQQPVREAAQGLVGTETQELVAGTTLSHYEVLSLLATGGMGQVYLAEDLTLKRKVALKVLSSFYTRDERGLRRFEREAQAASALNHPNIVTIYEFGQVNELQYIVSEFVDGITLRQKLSQGRLELETTLDVAVQIAGALEAAHAAGIIHRDIKPENVMVRNDGLVKILDFGIAKLSRAGQRQATDARPSSVTQSGMLIGTVAYMSPEQATGKEVDSRTDLFSFGVVLYEMATGTLPFPGDTAGAVIERMLTQAPISPLQLNPDIPTKFEEIMRRALQKDRDVRYQHASDICAELQRIKRDTDSSRTTARESKDAAATADVARIRSGERSVTSAARQVVVREEPASPRHHILRFVVSGVCLTLVLIGLELLFESFTVMGQEFQLTSYRLTQHRLSSKLSKPLPVTIVDVSDLEPKLVAGTDSKATPRRELQQVLEAIAAQNPSAIAIDIDFSPDENGWIDPVHDPQFFEACLTLKSPSDRPIPVYLGVNRAQLLGPQSWLGDERYEPLAASMIIPRDAQKMIAELQVPGSPKPLLSLATRLADAYQRQQPIPLWARWGQSLGLLQSVWRSDLHGIHLSEFVIDYAPRLLLQNEIIRYRQLQSLDPDQARERFWHKMVVTGAAELDKTTDVFSVMDQPTPGTIIVASAAYTLVQSTPLYELTTVGNILISSALSAAIFWITGGLCFKRSDEQLVMGPVRIVCMLLVGTIALLAGVMFVRYTHIAWNGFVIVLLALVLHNPFESLIGWLRKALPKALDSG
jgi:serine/threonine protein kinase